MPDYDPRLKAAMADIRAIAKKYDIALACMLVSPSHSEHSYQFPGWSPVQFENPQTGEEIRFRARSDQFTNAKSHIAMLEAGVHIVEHMRLFGARTFEGFHQLMGLIEGQIEIERSGSEFRPHQADDEEDRRFWER